MQKDFLNGPSSLLEAYLNDSDQKYKNIFLKYLPLWKAANLDDPDQKCKKDFLNGPSGSFVKKMVVLDCHLCKQW